MTEYFLIPSDTPSVSAATNVTEDIDMATEGEYFGNFHVNIIVTALVMLVIAIASPTEVYLVFLTF